MPTGTTNYNWQMPDVGDTTNAWGAMLNTLLQAVDTTVKGIDTVSAAALPKAGGALTGRLDLTTSSRVTSALGNVTGITNIDNSVAQVFTATLTGDWSPGITNVPANASGFLLELTGGGAHVITWPGTVKWASGSAPALSGAGVVDLLAFVTTNGGATWRAVLVSKASS